MEPVALPLVDPVVERWSRCDNTCATARDGTCDDGRPSWGQNSTLFYSDLQPVTCDLGTDCADCGVWETTGTVESMSWRPVLTAHAAKRGMEVLRVAAAGGFFMAVGDPEQDQGASSLIRDAGYYEPTQTQIAEKIFRNCTDAAGGRALVADVGAGFGQFALLAASRGCRVVVWEPVPSLRTFLQYSLQLNGLTHLVSLREEAAGPVTGAATTLIAPLHGRWDSAGPEGLAHRRDDWGDKEVLEAVAERIDGVVRAELLLLRVALRGQAPRVLQGARDVFTAHGVRNVLLEYSPGLYEDRGNWTESALYPETLAALLNAGFGAYAIDPTLDEEYRPFEGAVPALERVTLEELQHDVDDMVRAQTGALGCPRPDGVEQFRYWVSGCVRVPDHLHPLSFHSSFPHATTVWATRALAVEDAGRARAADPRTFNISSDYFLPGFGIGRRLCYRVPRASRLSSRCRCRNRTSKNVCIRAEAALEEAARAGQLVPAAVDAPDVRALSVDAW